MTGHILLWLSLVLPQLAFCFDSRPVLPSSQSKSFWDQIKANNEHRTASRGPATLDAKEAASASASSGAAASSVASGAAQSASLREVLESKKARRNLECRPDFCYRSSSHSSAPSASSGAAAASAASARICGTDGKTYQSRCMLQFLRRCHGQKVKVRHLGACGAPLPEGAGDAAGGGTGDRRQSRRRSCQQSRLTALSRSTRGEQVIYVPQCRRDGKFRRVQCNYQLKYCFCVRKRSGKPLPGTGVQLPHRPRCKRRVRSPWKESQTGRDQRQQQQKRQQQNQKQQQQQNKNKKRKKNRKGRRRKPGNGRKNRCSSRQRAQFNRNILKQFEVEFNASMMATRGGGGGSGGDGGMFKPKREASIGDVSGGGGLPIYGVVEKTLRQPERRSAEWKFSELDDNNDGQLSYRETKALRKVTRANIKPKGCARRFFSTCDLNANKRLERAEWILCFGLDNSATATAALAMSAGPAAAAAPTAAPSAALAAAPASFGGGGESATSSVGVGRKGSLMELVSRRRKRKRAQKARPFASKSCRLAREEALEKNRRHRRSQTQPVGGRVFVPECSPDGKYAKRQCHSDTSDRLCFCMDPESGRVLKSRGSGGSSGAGIDCESAHLRERATASAGFRGCSQPLLRKFAVQLTVLMVQETRDAWTPQDRHLSVEARSLRLRFQRADVNRDGRLDRKEQRWWRRDVKSRWKATDRAAELRPTRKCAANFLRFCNADRDAVVTLPELQACLSVPPA